MEVQIMADIDELSRMIGKLQSDINYIRKSTDAIDVKVDKTHEDMIRAKVSVESAHKRIDEISPHVQDFVKLKQRGLGIMGVLSLVFGFIGAFLGKILTVLMN